MIRNARKNGEVHIPSLREHPQYQAAAARLVELQLEVTTAEQELAELRAHIESYHSDGFSAQVQEGRRSYTPKRYDSVSHAAAEMIVGEVPVTLDPPPPDIVPLQKRLKVLRRAVEMQQLVLDRMTAAVSKELCTDELRAAYAQLVATIADRLDALQEAEQAEREFRDAMEAGGVHFSGWIPPHPSAAAGQGDYSHATLYRTQAIQYGYINK